jgi:LysR family glycine cleavage system transcriptional activator
MKTLPFPAMRALEAVVRLRSFVRAADELGVTQSAISQHIRTLENWTGCKLVVRGPRRSVPTEQGQQLASAIADGIGQISDLIEKMKSPDGLKRTIDISCPPGFAINWLFPRLLGFDLAHPDIPVSISTQTAWSVFETGNADVAIRYGLGGYSGLHVERLMGERVFPVCAPVLRDAGLRTPADLAGETILIDDLEGSSGTPPTWDFWATEVGARLPTLDRTRKFGQSNLAIQAAVQGSGVALGREPLVIDALHAGKLVRPFAGVAISQYSYWFVCPQKALGSQRICLFRDWLVSEAKNQPDLPAFS